MKHLASPGGVAGPTMGAPRAWVLSARVALAVATAGWVFIVAGYANHQERLNNSLATAPAQASMKADPELLLDRISSWALLHDAEYFARYRSTLDPGGGFNKFWWLAAVQAAGLLMGLAATVWPASTARMVASSFLAMSQAPDLPETCVETLYNYRHLGVKLPSYRVAIVVGAAVVPAANLAAAMVLGWNPAPRGPDATAVTPPPPEERDPPLRAWQCRFERFSLGIADRVRSPWLKATVATQWVCTVVGVMGYAIGVASGKWWRTHLPLCGITLGVQVIANAASTVALQPWTEGRGSGTALAAEGCALLLGIWRINRSWAGGVTLVAVRTGVVPPPGYIIFNAAVIAWLGCASLGPMTFLGLRAPQAGDAELSALPYRVVGMGVAGVVELAGVLFMTAATLVTNTEEQERRMWAGEVAFSQTGDRWWLMYTLVVYYALFFTEPYLGCIPIVFARSREVMAYGKVVIALGTNYMVNKSTNAAVNAGLWMLAGGYLLACFSAVLATDGPRGVHTYPARAARLVRRAACGWRGGRPPPPPPPGRLTLVASPVDPESGKKGGSHTVHLLQAGNGASGSGSPGDSARGGGGRGGRASRGGGASPAKGGRPGPAPDDVVLEWLIGTGSFASVFRASYAGAPCAVKVLSAASPTRRAAARAEAELALSLRHPCVLATFAVLDVDVDTSSLAFTTSPRPRRRDRGGGVVSAGPAATAALAEFGPVLNAGGRDEGEEEEAEAEQQQQQQQQPSPASPPASAALPGGPASPAPSLSTRRQQTWIVQELADWGTLDRAIRKGVFRRARGGGGGCGGAPSPGLAGRWVSPPTQAKAAAAAAAASARLEGSPPPPGTTGWPSPTLANGSASGGGGLPPLAPSPFTTPVKGGTGSGGGGGGGSGGPGLPSPAASLLATLHDIASGLAYLHAVGIVHGDLKPANILLRSRARDGVGRAFSALVADFGLSRVLATAPGASPRPPGAADPAPTHVHTQTFGTICYVAPELIKEGRLSRAADLYSLGVVMWELWSGRPPFRSLHAASIFYAVGVEGRRPEPALVDAPADYVALMEGLWADTTHARPSAADAARRLWAMLEAEVGGGGSRGGIGECVGEGGGGAAATSASDTPLGGRSPSPPAPGEAGGRKAAAEC